MLTASQFQHWCASLHLSQETASLSRHLALSANMRVLWDGRIWTIVNLGQTRITLRSEEDMLSESLGDHDGASPSHPIARRFQPDLC